MRVSFLTYRMKSMLLVNEAENNPTECQIQSGPLSKTQWKKSSSIIELGIVSTDSHSAKGSNDQKKMVSTKTNWKGSHSW